MDLNYEHHSIFVYQMGRFCGAHKMAVVMVLVVGGWVCGLVVVVIGGGCWWWEWVGFCCKGGYS